MCLLAYCETRKLTYSEFSNAWYQNDEGMGIAWSEGGKMHFVKGFMTEKKAWKYYQGFNKLPHIIHFRLTSAGKAVPELTHPFVISEDSPLSLKGEADALLFHNGTISGWKEMGLSHFLNMGKMPEGELSDTRVAAMIVAKLGKKALNLMYGKFILATPTLSTMYGDFSKVKGVFFSNTSYKPYVAPVTTGKNFMYDDKYWAGLTGGVNKALSEDGYASPGAKFCEENEGYRAAYSKKGRYCTCYEPDLIEMADEKYMCATCGLDIDPEDIELWKEIVEEQEEDELDELEKKERKRKTE